MPRPGVNFASSIGPKDSGRQAIANGTTTVYRGVAASWEPGLRSIDNSRRIIAALEALGPSLAAAMAADATDRVLSLQKSVERTSKSQCLRNQRRLSVSAPSAATSPIRWS
jgi:alpha-D-ribose 1-methylphosphonate 5-triphosphate diphosphatase PhnM